MRNKDVVLILTDIKTLKTRVIKEMAQVIKTQWSTQGKNGQPRKKPTVTLLFK